ncbi:hypothetical protein ACVXHB_01030 [Escherichia coli]
MEGVSQSAEFSGEECTAVADTPGRKLEEIDERTPVCATVRRVTAWC